MRETGEVVFDLLALVEVVECVVGFDGGCAEAEVERERGKGFGEEVS